MYDKRAEQQNRGRPPEINQSQTTELGNSANKGRVQNRRSEHQGNQGMGLASPGSFVFGHCTVSSSGQSEKVVSSSAIPFLGVLQLDPFCRQDMASLRCSSNRKQPSCMVTPRSPAPFQNIEQKRQPGAKSHPKNSQARILLQGKLLVSVLHRTQKLVTLASRAQFVLESYNWKSQWNDSNSCSPESPLYIQCPIRACASPILQASNGGFIIDANPSQIQRSLQYGGNSGDIASAMWAHQLWATTEWKINGPESLLFNPETRILKQNLPELPTQR